MTNINESGEKTQEFPEGKEAYCPKCYFENEKTILKKDCPHSLEKSTIDKKIEWVLLQRINFIGDETSTFNGYPDAIIKELTELYRTEIEALIKECVPDIGENCSAISDFGKGWDSACEQFIQNCKKAGLNI